jgi:hypothetical protein
VPFLREKIKLDGFEIKSDGIEIKPVGNEKNPSRVEARFVVFSVKMAERLIM